MAAASRTEGAPTAFMWGINGAMSVVASVFAVLIAMFFGINASFGAGFVAYSLAALSLLVIVRRLTAGTPAGPGKDDDNTTDGVSGNGHATGGNGAEGVTAGPSAGPAATANTPACEDVAAAGDGDGDGVPDEVEEPEPEPARAGPASKDD